METIGSPWLFFHATIIKTLAPHWFHMLKSHVHHVQYVDCTQVQYVDRTHVQYVDCTQVQYVDRTHVQYVDCTQVQYVNYTYVQHVDRTQVRYVDYKCALDALMVGDAWNVDRLVPREPLTQLV